MGSENILRITLVCTIWMQTISLSAGDYDFRAAEDSLQGLALNIIKPAGDDDRLANNALFFNALLDVLQQKGSMEHPFDSLSTVSVLQHPERSIRLFTWYVPLQQERFSYFGFIQLADAASARLSSVFVLSDSTQYIMDPLHEKLSAERWYGAYYYDMVTHETAGGALMTLLGWKGDNPYTRKRIIEPLSIRNDTIVFGRQMFRGARGNPQRIVFEYASYVSMSLLYEEHFLHASDTLGTPMIVFDRLAPVQEQFRGQYRHYVPEGNIFDALLIENAEWIFQRDVDVRFSSPEMHE